MKELVTIAYPFPFWAAFSCFRPTGIPWDLWELTDSHSRTHLQRHIRHQQVKDTLCTATSVCVPLGSVFSSVQHYRDLRFHRCNSDSAFSGITLCHSIDCGSLFPVRENGVIFLEFLVRVRWMSSSWLIVATSSLVATPQQNDDVLANITLIDGFRRISQRPLVRLNSLLTRRKRRPGWHRN